MVDVHATVETAPVSVGGDAADDPAIWVNKKDPAKSVIIGSNKRMGLHVYDLQGKELQFVPHGRMNNVDLRDGFRLGGREVTLVTAGNRSNDTIAIYVLDHDKRTLVDVAAREIKTATAYGSCMYRSAKTGKFYYFLANKAGIVEQWELFEAAGKVDAKMVRTFNLPSQLEGCAADDELGHLYVGEEAAGVWKLGAEPEAGDTKTQMALAGAGHPLTPDVEGIAIAATGPGKGYIIVSSQGNNSFAVFRREGDNAFVKSFRVVTANGVDGAEETDGLDVTAASLGGPFAKGLIVVHDGVNDDGFQNFKLVPLDRVVDLD